MGEERQRDPMNWADVLYLATFPLLGFAEGLVLAVHYVQQGLQQKSEAIDAQRRFAREARLAIEQITGGQDG